MLFLGSHWIKGYSTTQKVIALSSGEAELYGMVKGSSHALGLRSLLLDFGIDSTIDVHTDASAAIGITCRKGLGKVRHLETNQLWIQDKVKSKEISVHKCKGPENPADALTKPVKNDELTSHIWMSGMLVKGGRHSMAPQVSK